MSSESSVATISRSALFSASSSSVADIRAGVSVAETGIAIGAIGVIGDPEEAINRGAETGLAVSANGANGDGANVTVTVLGSVGAASGADTSGSSASISDLLA